jgi:hypothetical protein
MFTNLDAKAADQTVGQEWQQAMNQIRTGGLDEQSYWNAFFFTKITELEKNRQEANKTISQLQLELQELKKLLEEQKNLNIQNTKRFKTYDDFLSTNQ